MLLLALLGDEPRHGYQLMQQIETRSNGCYRPSAGVIYPALTRLEAEGYTLGIAAGKRKSYRLTEAGRRQVEGTRESVALLWAKLDFLGQKMALVRRAFAADEALADPETPGSGRTVMAAFEALQSAVLVGDKLAPAAQLRIVAALKRASQEILAAAAADQGAR